MSLDPRNPGPGSDPFDVSAPSSDAGLSAPAGEVVLVVSGEVDLATRDELLIRLLTLVLTRRRRVVIDLADVDFMDAAGASALRQGHKLAGDLGAQVTLRAPQSNVLRVLELTGTDLFMAIE